MRGCRPWLLALVLACPLGAAPLSGRPREAGAPSLATLSIVGTTDLHGFVFPRNGRGGLALLAGFLDNLRAARAADGGAVLLLDAGDTFQGGIESNLSEGALVVDAFNAMGYTAAAIGNHEFDFGPVDTSDARQVVTGDPRGALKARAAQAKYPFLAANLIDDRTDRPVDWPNVRPSVIVDAAGVKVGIIGVMTIDALRATLPVNVHGLRLAPLAPTIAAEAAKSRAAGAEVVVVTAHAGGACARFERPADLSSCDLSSEIFSVARSLPRGLVDVIAAGHTHDAVAHQVGEVAIVQAYALGRAFARADVVFDRHTRRVVRTNLFAPRDVCARQDPETLGCEPGRPSAPPLPVSRYEGRMVTPDSAVVDAMAPALQRVRRLQAAPIGVFVHTPLRRAGDVESPLGNLFADALREEIAGTDIAINNNSRGGLRADIPAGALTFGRLYDVFPFDNRLVRLTLTGDQLRHVFEDEIRRGRRGALGISGVVVKVGCGADGLDVELFRTTGRPIGADERVVVVAMDSLVSGLTFATVTPPAGFGVGEGAPLVREVVEDWLRQRGGQLDPAQFVDPDHRRWELPAMVQAECAGL
jgi:2',3'-cyclic-nucleotide 2'-phosphodiesterase (5'-nucleotidase family)